ncbi:MAG: glycosyltransferase family 4 protein [Candidatus Doudnabacteria bacterium]|nr:glycosyltransferase family 4 protein [Candidatus Doudnabacteria bacterium]
MTIAIDLRSIQRGTFTGVENYTLSLLERMIREDKQNKYVLFYNGLSPVQAEDLRFLNTSVVVGRVPNKVLALSTTFAQRPDFTELIGSQFDCLFMPNINHVVLRPPKRLVVTVHDLSPVVLPEHYDIRRRLWHWSVGFRRTLQRADAIIAVSEFTKQQLVDVLGLPASKITVVYQGIDAKRFHPNVDEVHLRDVRNRYGLPGEYVFYCGTLEPRKNVERLIGAWERMEHHLPLVIAGKPGWKYRTIFNRAKQSSRVRQIQFLGFVEESDKAALYKLAAVTAFPSLYEGFGLPVLESMAVGTPVVTSQVTSLPEVCGSAGVLVDPYDEVSIAVGLDSVVGDRNFRAALAAEGLLRAKKFSWDKTAEQTLAVLTAGRAPDMKKLGIFE